jgi:hypothetical protein
MYKITVFFCTIISTFLAQSLLAQEDDFQTIYYNGDADGYQIAAEADIYSKVGEFSRGNQVGCLETTLREFRITSIIVDGITYTENDFFPDIEMPNGDYGGLYEGFSIPFSNGGALPKIQFEVSNIPDKATSTLTISENGKKGGCIYFDVLGTVDEAEENWKYVVVGNHQILSLEGGEATTLASKIRNYLKIKGKSEQKSKKDEEENNQKMNLRLSAEETLSSAKARATSAKNMTIPEERLRLINESINLAESAKSKAKNGSKVYFESVKLIESLKSQKGGAIVAAKQAEQELENSKRELEKRTQEKIEKFKREQKMSPEVRQFTRDWEKFSETMVHYIKQAEENRKKIQEQNKKRAEFYENWNEARKRGFKIDRVKYQTSYSAFIAKLSKSIDENPNVMTVAEAIERGKKENLSEVYFLPVKVSGPTMEGFADGDWIYYKIENPGYNQFYRVSYKEKPGKIILSDRIFENRFKIQELLFEGSCTNCLNQPEFIQNFIFAATSKKDLYQHITSNLPLDQQFTNTDTSPRTQSISRISSKNINKLLNDLQQENTEAKTMSSLLNKMNTSNGVFELNRDIIYFNKGKYIRITVDRAPDKDYSESSFKYIRNPIHINNVFKQTIEPTFSASGLKGQFYKFNEPEVFVASKYRTTPVFSMSNDYYTLRLPGEVRKIGRKSYKNPHKRFASLQNKTNRDEPLSSTQACDLLVVDKDHYRIIIETGTLVKQNNKFYGKTTGLCDIGPGIQLEGIVSRKSKVGTRTMVYEIQNKQYGWYVMPDMYYDNNQFVVSTPLFKDIKYTERLKNINISIVQNGEQNTLSIGSSQSDFNSLYQLIKNKELFTFGEVLNFSFD